MLRLKIKYWVLVQGILYENASTVVRSLIVARVTRLLYHTLVLFSSVGVGKTARWSIDVATAWSEKFHGELGLSRCFTSSWLGSDNPYPFCLKQWGIQKRIGNGSDHVVIFYQIVWKLTLHCLRFIFHSQSAKRRCSTGLAWGRTLFLQRKR